MEYHVNEIGNKLSIFWDRIIKSLHTKKIKIQEVNFFHCGFLIPTPIPTPNLKNITFHTHSTPFYTHSTFSFYTHSIPTPSGVGM